MELSNQKPFEKPDAGTFTGTIIDVVDLPNYPTSFGPKNKVRIVWVLGGAMPGQKVVDSEGKPFQVIAMPNGSMNEKSTLFKLLTQILGQAPPVITTSEQLSELLIGRSNVLFLTKSPNPQKQGDWFVNVAGVSPLVPGLVAPAAPAGYVRAKDKTKTIAGPNGQPVQTFAQPPANAAQAGTAPATPTPTPAPAPPPSNNVAF